MIAASGILVIIAFVTLIIGVFQAGLGLIWASIAASVLAAIFLALGVVQSNKRRVATAGPGTAPMPSWADQPATAAMPEREAAPGLSVVTMPADEEEEQEEEEEEEAEPETVVATFEPPARTRARAPTRATPTPTRGRAAAKPAPAKPAAKAAAAKAAPAKAKKAAVAATVVVIPDRDKFHLESCRYAKNATAVSMTKAAARRQGYKPCATCKP